MSRFQLEKLRTACLNKNTHVRRLSPKWPTEKAEKRVFQTFRRVEGKMFFSTTAEAAAHVCVCADARAHCAQLLMAVGSISSKVRPKVHHGLPGWSLNRCCRRLAVSGSV